MKSLIIYHANCNDGFGAAWVAYHALTRLKPLDDIVLYPATYGQEPPLDLIDNHTDVYIVDFSYSVEHTKDIAAKAYCTVVLDHHKTAIENFAGVQEIVNCRTVFDVTKSGAMLTWDYFHSPAFPTPVPQLVQYIQDRDLWKFELEGTREVHLNLSTYPQTIAAWDKVSQLLEVGVTRRGFISEGAAIKRYYDKIVSDIIRSGKSEFTIDGIVGLVCNAPYVFASDIGNILAKESETFGATWYETANNSVVFSLRSVGDFDVSEIAKKFGGGGHKNAAGFKLGHPTNPFTGNNGITLWSSDKLDEFAKDPIE